MTSSSAITTSTAADVSVVICAYLDERWEYLLAAIASVLGQTASPREVIVAVDHNPVLLERLQREVAGVTVVDSLGPRGKPGALNTAVEAASGRVIALLDDDAVAEPRWLEELVKGYADPLVLGIGGRIEPIWATGRPAWFPEEFLWVVGCTYRGMPAERAQVRNLIGANMSFLRSAYLDVAATFADEGSAQGVLAQLGRTDAASRHALEDTELCLRVSRQHPDHLWLYEPRAVVRHNVPAARARWSYFRSRCYVEGTAKAGLARTYGSGQALESERRYTLRTLPSGVFAGLGDAVLHRRPAGIARAVAIVAGLLITTTGYVRARLVLARRGATVVVPA